MKIVFATNNKHKLDEVKSMLGGDLEVVSLAEVGCFEDIPETGKTLQENALQKATYVFEKYGLPCFADDTGLEVEALGGEPGIYSARYAAMNNAGVAHDSEANMAILLRKLCGQTNRRARFRTVICLYGLGGAGDVRFFEGVVEGVITTERSGAEGFGYDPIFRPEGYDKTFAELGNDVKNGISHRARAVGKLVGELS